MTAPTPTETDFVDPALTFEGYASLKNHGGHPIKAVQAAYNAAVRKVTEAGRAPVLIRVLVHVAPRAPEGAQ